MDRTIEERCELIEDDNISDKKSKLRIYVNLLSLMVIWMFAFTAFSGLQNLENTINPDIGVYSLAVITGGGFISCIFAPAVISKVGAKGALIISALCLSIFVASNYYPKSYLLLPGAAVYGLSTGIMWTAQGSYITTMSIQFSSITKQTFEAVISRFFGIFCMAFQSTQIWGNIISSIVLQSSDDNTTQTEDLTRQCGASFCPNHNAPSNNSGGPANEVSDTTLYTLTTVYLGCSIIALAITVIFLKPIASNLTEKKLNIKQLLFSTVKLLATDLNMMLIVPIALYSGAEQVVMYAEFTRAYIACEIGVGWIGYGMISFGVVNTIVSPLVGFMVKYVGRPLLFVAAMVVDAGLLVLLRLWVPNENQMALFFVIPGAWAFADAIWQTQNSSLVGYSFPDNQEPAYANLRLWEALGFMIPYLYSNSLCVDIKLYIVGGWLIVSVIMVMIVEYRLSRSVAGYRRFVE